MASYKPEAAIICWHGPFPLEEEVLSNEGLRVPIEGHGIYILIGQRSHRVPFTSMRFTLEGPRILYIGQTTSEGGFLARLRQHTSLTKGSGAKVLEIARRKYLFDSVLLGHCQDPVTAAQPIGDKESVLDVVEGLLIWLFKPRLNDETAPNPRVPPVHRFFVLHRFNEDIVSPSRKSIRGLSKHEWPRWRPDELPDFIDYFPEPATGELTWLGKRTHRRTRRVRRSLKPGLSMK